MVRIPDVFKFAAEGGVLAGEVPLAALSRLADQLAKTDAGDSVRWRVRGGIDEEGRYRLDLDVSGRLVLRCQRCLGDLSHDLAVDAALHLVRAGQKLPEDELENDEIDAIEVAGELDVLSLVEDEIILALPIAPRHEECGASRPKELDGGARRESPFAVLAGLRGRQQEQV
jgi:uncharacterized protein